MIKHLFLFLLLSSVSLFGQSNHIKIILMAGQSNMTGMADNADLPINLQSTQTNMPIYVSIQGDGSIIDKWTYLKPGDGNSSLNHGCEVSFGDSLKKAYPNDSFAIIKCSSPGSCLETQWFSPSIGPWGGLYYNTFLISVNAALNSLPVGTTYEIVGMLWMQGETDATLATWANNYENNLTAFISDIRTALAAPQMPFMIGKIDIQTAWAYNSIVRQAQQNVAANVANCEFIETNGYATGGVHYLSAGYVKMGHDFVNVLAPYLNNTSTGIILKHNEKIATYPNPVTNELIIETGNSSANGRFELLNSSGQVVFKGQLLERLVVNMMNFSSGIYVLKILKEKDIQIKKIVKN